MNNLKAFAWVIAIISIITIAYVFEPKTNITTNQADLAVLQQLADGGDRKGQLMLGLAYKNGEYGLKPDISLANKWIELAAKNGNEYAKQMVKNEHLPPVEVTPPSPTVVEVVWGHYRNVALFIISILLLVGYHINWWIGIKRGSDSSFQVVTMKARESWVTRIMTTHPTADILAVQTLRNSTMAATFLASTAILLIIGVLNVAHFGTVADAISTSTQHSALHAFKVGPLLLMLFAAFFLFTLSIRMFNHVGYLINCGHPDIKSDYVSHVLNRGGEYYSFGMRSYYLSIPFVCWLFNPLLMLISSVVMIFVLRHVDHVSID